MGDRRTRRLDWSQQTARSVVQKRVEADGRQILAEYHAVGRRIAAFGRKGGRGIVVPSMRMQRRADDLQSVITQALGAPFAGLDHPLLKSTRSETGEQTAFGFDLPEFLPRRLAERSCEDIQVLGARLRIAEQTQIGLVR